ncbi:MAG: histidine kinase N-terminal 7TM domain-containing protein [Cyanobacteria bacterium P01_A01_bin.114]
MRFYLVFALLPAIAAFTTGSMTIFAWQRRELPGARVFSLFSGSIFIWSFFAVFEYLSTTASSRALFGKLEYFGIIPFPVFWLIFTLQYTHSDGWLAKRYLAALFVLPSVSFSLAMTDPWHGMIWRSTTWVAEPYPNLIIEHGWWFNHVMVPYSYLLTLGGIGALLKSFVGSTHLYQRQALNLLIAALISFMCNVVYIVSNVTLYGMDLTPIGFAVSSILLHLGLFQGKLFEVSPLSYRTVFLNSTESVIILDLRGNVVDLNPSALRESDLPHVLGLRLEDAFPQYYKILQPLSALEVTQTVELRQQPPAFKEIKVRSLLSQGKRRVGSLIIIRDVTLERQQQAQLEKFAYFDGLTGLFNRRQFVSKAEQALQSETPANWPIALLYIDLDKFKPINDTYGHEVGDAILVRAANRLRYSVRQGDMTARMGGDEFVVLLLEADRTVALSTRRRILASLTQPIRVRELTLYISASIGIACCSQPGSLLSDLLNQADQDMYRTKQQDMPIVD